MRPILISALMLVGCTTETVGLFAVAPYDAGSEAHVANRDVRAIDARAVIDTNVDVDNADGDSIEAGALAQVDVSGDTYAIDGLSSAQSCIQRAIDNGYASCPPGDRHHASCDACATDAAVNAKCKVIINCMRKEILCDVECFKACVAPSSVVSPERECVNRVVTPFCNEWQPWMAIGYRSSCS